MIRLESVRLIYRDHKPADLEAYCEMESDAEYRFPQIVHPQAELERSFWNATLPVKEMGLLATVKKADDTYIGRTGLYPFRDERDEIVPGEAWLAYYIARPYWRQGFAREAAAAFIEHGFRSLGMHRIHGGASPDNVASLRILEGLGMARVSAGLYQISREQWLTRGL